MKQYDGEKAEAGASTRIQAAVAFAGVFDFVSRFADPRQTDLQPKGRA